MKYTRTLGTIAATVALAGSIGFAYAQTATDPAKSADTMKTGDPMKSATTPAPQMPASATTNTDGSAPMNNPVQSTTPNRDTTMPNTNSANPRTKTPSNMTAPNADSNTMPAERAPKAARG